jgi:hypothetical protein
MSRKCAAAGIIVGLCLGGGLPAAAQEMSLPAVRGPIPVTADSHAFLAADHQAVPLDLSSHGYVEEEYLVSGEAGIYSWPGEAGLKAMAHGPYVTRILVRRPVSKADFSGTVIVEGLNPSSPVDLPIMWAESYRQFMADGVAWVGVTVKPNTIRALKVFDEGRYGDLAMRHPQGGPSCGADAINSWSQPVMPDEETGLVWDMLTQIGLLLKSDGGDNPLGQPAQRLFMTGQSQTAGYARTYATVFARPVAEKRGAPLYDGYLYSGSPPWQVPFYQCAESFADGDPRLLTGPAGVPVIELFAQGDIGTNLASRRADADQAPDLYRRYEVAGAAHVDPWEARSFPSAEDMRRTTGQASADAEADCQPKGVAPTDFPVRYVFDAAWRHLEAWVGDKRAAPRAPRLQVKDGPFQPDGSFVTDAHGNALGGVRTPYVDVPTARWVGAKTGAFQCLFQGYKFPFDDATLKRLYPSHADYVAKVKASVGALREAGWLSAADGEEIVSEAQAAQIP